ncbi:hypothetical protein ABIB48_003535 [Arthrobacter sp. UYCu511]
MMSASVVTLCITHWEEKSSRRNRNLQNIVQKAGGEATELAPVECALDLHQTGSGSHVNPSKGVIFHRFTQPIAGFPRRNFLKRVTYRRSQTVPMLLFLSIAFVGLFFNPSSVSSNGLAVPGLAMLNP